MKKFLSLVLALVMTMSLVTIGAGATEYKDLTDKSDVQYQEAVAVLNKVGVITGYEDGSFKPTGALTRGAAAKIIVSLMIGADAASSLSVTAAPYKDVPVTNTFASVISYCKTAGYINGYTDGTFRPTASLTGYAFAKMLLGALGYKGDIEGFTGSGWTMKVASVGSVAGLYNDFITPFSGNDGVTREQACQLALNTLKATEVEYKGNNINVSTGTANVSVTDQNHTDVENNSNTDGNIDKTDAGYKDGKDGKMQFAEQHFTDLKQMSDTTTTFGRPATRWSYKNVTIDKFAKQADFTFTASLTGYTDKDKVEDMGLNGYKLYKGTNVTINDKAATATTNTLVDALKDVDMDDAVKTTNSSVATQLVALTGNGIVVEIYLDDDNADIISDIVVIRTQLMEVNTVSSKTITLKQLDEVGNDDDPTTVSTDKYFKATSSVKDDDDAFADLKDCESEDYMLATYAADGSSWSVDSAKAPTVVTGALTAVTKNNSNKVNGVTVGGTTYKLAAIRDDGFATMDISSVSSSKKDVTLYLDAYGYATYIKDQGSTSNFMVYGDSYSTLVNGKLVTTLTGWDMKGNDVSITVKDAGTAKTGDLLKYTTTSSSSASYDYTVSNENGIATGEKSFTTVATGTIAGATAPYEIKAGATVVYYGTGASDYYTIASGVKTIFVDFNDDDSTIKSVTVKNGLANVTNEELKASKDGCYAAQMYVNKDGGVEAVVVKTTSSDAVSDNVLYVESIKSSAVVDGTRTYTYHVWVNGAEDDYTSTDKVNDGYFATYAENSDGTYKMSNVTKTDAVTSAFKLTLTKANIDTVNKNLIYSINGTSTGTNYTATPITAYAMDGYSMYDSDDNDTRDTLYIEAGTILNATGAQFSDLTDHGFASMKDLFDSTDYDSNDEFELTIVMNNKNSSDNYLKVAAVAVTHITTIA